MLAWLVENLATILICIVLIAVVAAIIVHMVKERKHGSRNSSCGCGCSGCSMSGACHQKR